MKKKSILQENGTDGCILSAGHQLQHVNAENFSAPRKPDQSSFENLKQQFLSAMKTGNKQDQIQNLRNMYLYLNNLRKKICVRQIRRSQFLEDVQCFVEYQGLVFGKHLQNMRFGK